MSDRRRGVSLLDLLAVLATVVVLCSLALPALGRLRGMSQTDVSLANLAVLGLGAQLYAADWNGRQVTVPLDELAQFGNTAAQALANVDNIGEPHPPIILGWGFSGLEAGTWGYFFWNGSNAQVVEAISYNTGFGHFRLPNARPLHAYVGGRWFDERFYAPADTVPFAQAEPWFDEAEEYIPAQVTGNSISSSYCFSPAALVDPAVLRPPSLGGWQDPWALPFGVRVPPRAAALFPDLKTEMIEHHWLQGPPADCNPAFRFGTFGGCEPYYFNHGLASSPAALFYDGHVRLLPNAEVQAADQQVLRQTGGLDGLWSRDTPFGAAGYFLDEAFDSMVDVSHHVLTTGGIQGRDTTATSLLGGGTPALPGPFRRGHRRATARLPAPPVEAVQP